MVLVTALVAPILVLEPAPVQAPVQVLAPAPVVAAQVLALAPAVAVQVLALAPVVAVQVLALAQVAAVQVLALALVVACFLHRNPSRQKTTTAMVNSNAPLVSTQRPVVQRASRTLRRQTMASVQRAPY